MCVCVHEWLLKRKYLLTSYVSTNAINPSGNAIANDTIAANSPSFDSSGETSSNPDNCWRCAIADSSKFRTDPFCQWEWEKSNQWQIERDSFAGSLICKENNLLPVVLCLRLTFFNSSMPENDVMYACAWVPLTGILKSFPASTLDVPSKPPGKK